MKRVRWQMWALVSLMVLGVGCESEEVEEREQAVEEAPELNADEEGEREHEEPEAFDGETVAFPSNDWECSEERAEEIGEWIDAYRLANADRASMPLEVVDGLVERQGVLPERPPLLVQIKGLELEVEGRSTTDPEELTQRIEGIYRQRVEEANLLDEEPEGLSLALAIRGSATGERVEEVARALDEAEELEPEEFYLAFRAPALRERAEGIPEALQTRMMEDYQSARPEHPEEMVVPAELPAAQEELLESCPDVSEMMDGMETATPDARKRKFAEEAPEAWLACDCELDLEYLLAMVLWEPPRADGEVGHITFRATTLEALLEDMASQGDRPWSELEPELELQ